MKAKSTYRKRWGVPGGPDLLDQVPDLLDQVPDLLDRIPGWVDAMTANGLRDTVLRILSGGPRSGAELIEEIGALPGRPRITAEQLYPLLDQLTDENLVTAGTKDRPRAYALTEEGREAAARRGGSGAFGPFGSFDPFASAGSAGSAGSSGSSGSSGARPGEAHRLLGDVLMAAGRLEWSGDARRREQAAAVLAEARRELYRLLADEEC
ncbi:PadR family transcriptional regulator [Streptomyces fimicarius]|uniref:PadR family transcriptional regulator n=1 Tax=Streptomyces griseus TaxID=1911 RepID=UPI0036AF8221